VGATRAGAAGPSDAASHIEASAEVEYCYLTTTGRRSGREHTIEIWFVAHEGCAYLMAGSHRSDWVRNLRARPSVGLRVGDRTLAAVARAVDDATDARQAVLRARMADKYGQRDPGGGLNSWARSALLVEVCPEGFKVAPVA
jgi:deazaflavin-dependent oxidoreductase (nitroreductase family)